MNRITLITKGKYIYAMALHFARSNVPSAATREPLNESSPHGKSRMKRFLTRKIS